MINGLPTEHQRIYLRDAEEEEQWWLLVGLRESLIDSLRELNGHL